MGETHDEKAPAPEANPEAGAAGAEATAPADATPATVEVGPGEFAAAGDELPEGGGAGEPGVGGAAAEPEKLLLAKELVTGLLTRLGVDAEVEVRDSAEAIACNLRIRSGGELFATGPRGQVLEAAQYLANKMVNRDAEGRKWLSLDIGGVQEAAPDPAVERMARRLGEAAKRMGQTLTVVPMGAKDRRRVHVALAGVEGVKTRSEGDGLFRRLLVEPER